MKAPTLSDYIHDLLNVNEEITFRGKLLDDINNYNEFLRQPLKLDMFVPCDEEGNVFEEPNINDFIFEEHEELKGSPKEYDFEEYSKYIKKYKQALDQVIFKGFTARIESTYFVVESENTKWVSWNKSKTIQDIIHLVELNENGIKKAGL